MEQVEIAAICIGVILFALTLFIGVFTLYNLGTIKFKSINFYLKKWTLCVSIIAINTALCVAVYYSQNLQVIIFLIVVLKAKDIIMSIMFPINVIYRHFRPDIYKNIPPINSEEPGQYNVVAFIPTYTETIEQIVKTVDSVLQNNTQLVCLINDSERSDVSDIVHNVLLIKHASYISWKQSDIYVQCDIIFGTRNHKNIIVINKNQNLGKKDSIILCNNLFNVPSANRELRESILLDIANLFHLYEFHYIFCTDADTIIENNVIKCLVDSIEKRNALASCGIVNVNMSHSTINNDKQIFWNNIQHFQYIYGQYMRRMNEDLFNQVLCLPGCVCMLKICNNYKDAITMYSQTSDESNFILSCVQYLGTDRRLTSSLIFTYDKNDIEHEKPKIVFDTRSNAYTSPPSDFNSFIRQRKRWCQNMFFNTVNNIYGRNVHLMLRFFSIIDILRQSLVYFRLFNTIFFVYLLATTFSSTNIVQLVPYIVILSYPAFVFCVYALFNSRLRQQYITLLIMLVLNKVLSFLTNIIIFTVMLSSIGHTNWS